MTLGLGFAVSLPATGTAQFRDWTAGGFVTGVAPRTTETFVAAVPLAVEAGLRVGRFRLAAAVDGPARLFSEIYAGHVGFDLVPVSEHQKTFALTVWAGGGYETLHLYSGYAYRSPRLEGALVNARVTGELRLSRAFFLRLEGFARLQFMTKYDQENDGEGRYASFVTPCLTPQLGLTLSVGVDFPHA